MLKRMSKSALLVFTNHMPFGLGNQRLVESVMGDINVVAGFFLDN